MNFSLWVERCVLFSLSLVAQRITLLTSCPLPLCPMQWWEQAIRTAFVEEVCEHRSGKWQVGGRVLTLLLIFLPIYTYKLGMCLLWQLAHAQFMGASGEAEAAVFKVLTGTWPSPKAGLFCNSLPREVHLALSLPVFHRLGKTELLRQAFLSCLILPPWG